MNDLQQIVSRLSMRDKVILAESTIKRFENLEGLELKHHFSDGVYARELFIPKDTIIVGKIHKYENLNILSYGEMSVLIDEEVKRLVAPFITVSPSGIKRIAYTHTNCIWVTILRTDECDIERIEDHFTAQTEQDYLNFIKYQEQLKLPI